MIQGIDHPNSADEEARGKPMTQPNPTVRRRLSTRTIGLLALAFITGSVIMAGVGALLLNIQERRDEGRSISAPGCANQRYGTGPRHMG